MAKRRPVADKRLPSGLRPVKITRGFTQHPEGSVLIEQGNTRVLCTASVEDGVPPFLRDKGQGWLTAEYSMLPRSTHTRTPREAAKGKQSGRTLEIGRLIGRSLRAAVDLTKLGERTVTIDCDVLQADGGTRCASITGGLVALLDALAWLKREKGLKTEPLKHHVAAVSVGIVDGEFVLDLDYERDHRSAVDLNVVMTDDGRFIEVQGTAEGEPFTERQFTRLRRLAAGGIAELVAIQKRAAKGR